MLPGQMTFEKVPGFATVAPLAKGGASSTLKAPQKEGASPTVKASAKEGASSTLAIEDIERRRRKLGVSIERLLGEARASRNSWRQARKGLVVTRPSTLDRLDRALTRLAAGERATNESALTLAYRWCIALFAEKLGVDVAAAQAVACDFSAEKPQNPEWIAAARVRRLAIYTLCTACGQRNADVARAAGCSRQGVGKAIAEIEALRELDKVTDQLLARCAAMVWTGR